MTTDYILKLLNNCNCLNGFEISADFLKKEDKSICLKVPDTENIERTYCDGSGIFSSEIELNIRLTANHQKNLFNRNFFETLSSELTSFGNIIAFPNYENLIQPLKIEITEGANLLSDDIHSAKYKMKFRIHFLKEKRG